MPDIQKIQFHCPQCGKSIRVAREHAGKRGKCSGCGTVIPVPTEELNSNPSDDKKMEIYAAIKREITTGADFWDDTAKLAAMGRLDPIAKGIQMLRYMEESKPEAISRVASRYSIGISDATRILEEGDEKNWPSR